MPQFKITFSVCGVKLRTRIPARNGVDALKKFRGWIETQIKVEKIEEQKEDFSSDRIINFFKEKGVI